MRTIWSRTVKRRRLNFVRHVMRLDEETPVHFFLYKNQLYKNSEPQNGSKIKNNLRTNRGSKSSPTKKIEYLAKINTKNKNNLRTFEPCCASVIKNIEPRPKISASYK